jgi:hypothetical protein
VGATETTGATSVAIVVSVGTKTVVGVSATGICNVHAPKMKRIKIGRKNAILFMDSLLDVRITAASP